MYNNIIKLAALTNQQFEILRATDTSLDKDSTKLRNIEELYKKLSGKPIQKSNLFAQLRTLQKREFVIKVGNSYRVNKQKIKQCLLNKKLELYENAEICEKAAKDIDKVFTSRQTDTITKQQTMKNMFEEACEIARHSDYLCAPTPFPWVVFSERIARLNDAAEFVNTLKNLCLGKKLHAKYIVSLRAGWAFDIANKTLKDKQKAYEEVRTCYDNLNELIKIKNMEFRYLNTIHSSFSIWGSDAFTRLIFMAPYDMASQQVATVIIIENGELCMIYKKTFDEVWQSAVPLTKKLIMRVARSELRNIKAYIKNK